MTHRHISIVAVAAVLSLAMWLGYHGIAIAMTVLMFLLLGL